MTQMRNVAALLVSALFVQLALAVPALAVERILAARCCDADCPARPSATTSDRCCGIATAAATDPTVRTEATIAPPSTAAFAVVAVLAPAIDETVAFAPASPPGARAAPLYLETRSLRL